MATRGAAMTIDRDRLAQAVAVALHSVIVHDCDPQGQNHCEPEQHLDNAKTVTRWALVEYDRLTEEWRERLRSVNLAPSAVPTRGGKG